MLDALKRKLTAFAIERPRILAAASLTAFAAFSLLTPLAANAFSITEFFWSIVASFFELLARLCGFIMLKEIQLLMTLVQYSNFVNPGPTAVRVGWIVTRDIANMFFILILLFIAFNTILGREEYGYKKLLPRLLVTTIVINFSKTICGILIDFGQVVMLTFVNGFRQAAGGNFMRAFQVDKLLNMDSGSTGCTSSCLALSMALAFILMAVAASVMLVMVVMVAWRIIMLWLLIIMSPIAFLANTVGKSGEKYYQDWFGKLKNQIIVGPMLAFFLWLALISVQQGGGNIAKADGFSDIGTATEQEVEAERTRGGAGFGTEVSRTDLMLSFVIAVSLLMAGLQLAIATSDGAGKAFGSAVQGGLKKAAMYLPGKAQKYGKEAAGFAASLPRRGVDLATRPFRSAGKWAGKRAGEAGLRRGGGLMARVPLLNRLGRKAALKGEAMRAERMRRKYGSEKLSDVARLSPKKFSKFAGGATPEEAPEFAKIAQGNRGLMAQMQKDGSANKLRDAMWKRTKPDKDGNPTDQAALADYNTYMKANWKGARTPDERKRIFKSMSGDDYKQNFAPEDIRAANVDDMSRDGVLALMNGTPQQRQRMAGVLEQMEKRKQGDPTGKTAGVSEFLRAKGVSAAQVPNEFLSTDKIAYDGVTPGGQPAVITEGAQLFNNAILRAGRRDPSVASKMAENPKVAAKMGEVAMADMRGLQQKLAAGPLGAADKADFVSTVNVAIQTGKLDVSGVSTMTGMIASNFDVKDLANMVRYAPPDREDIQQAIKEAVTAAFTHGGKDIANAISKNPNLREYLKAGATNAAQAAASSAGGQGQQPFRGAGAHSRNQGQKNT